MLCRGRGKEAWKALLLELLLELLLGAVSGEEDGGLAPGLRLPALLLLCQQGIHPCCHSQAVRCAKIVPLAANPATAFPIPPLLWDGIGGGRQGARMAPPPPSTKDAARPSAAPPQGRQTLRLCLCLCLCLCLLLLLLLLLRAGLRVRPPMRHGICAI